MKTKKLNALGRTVFFVLLFTQAVQAQFKVIGYYPTYAGGYPNGINSIDLAKVTHVNIAFANPNAAGNLIPDYGTTANITTVVNACHAKGVKVFMSIGGGGASGTNYQTLFSSTANINSFVAKIVTFATTYSLDGIDVDIEGNILDGNTLTAAQYQNFVSALSPALHASSLKLSAALGSWFGNFVTNTAAAQFDWINMMSYDLCGPWTGACQHSPYSMATSDLQYWNSNKGVPTSKLIVGLPFYGYGWGSYANQGISYCNIVNTYPGSQNNDQVGSGSNVIYYNGVPTIKQKTTYATQNAAGVMIWELTQDCATTDSRSLLLAVSQVLAPLPVTWVDFHAALEQRLVHLYWSTANEKSNNYFAVESSSDGLSFHEVARAQAVGNSNTIHEYTYTDALPTTDHVYYRIKQVDTDGQFTYTHTVYVHVVSSPVVLIDVRPNPAVQQEINVHLLTAVDLLQLELTDVWGKQYYSATLTSDQAKENVLLKISGLPSGMYILSATGNGEAYWLKVIVN